MEESASHPISVAFFGPSAAGSFGTTLAPFKKTHIFHVLIMENQKPQEVSEQMIDSEAHIQRTQSSKLVLK